MPTDYLAVTTAHQLPVPRETPSWVSYSSLMAHRNCPQAWHYRYLRDLVPIEDIAAERDFGTWWHALRAAGAIVRGTKLGTLAYLPDHLKLSDTEDLPTAVGNIAHLPNVVLNKSETWWENQKREYQAEFVARVGAPLPEALAGLNVRWHKRWEAEIAAERPLGVEVRWERMIPQTEFTLVGYADEVYVDARRGMTVVRDAKTSKNLATQSAADDMMDSQLHLYAWGLGPLVDDWGARQVTAVGFDRARMIPPKPPQLTLSGRLAMRDGQPSIGNCDLDTYLDWVASEPRFPGAKKDGSGAGVYQLEEGVIETLSRPASRSIWFQRTLTPLNVNLIRVHLQAAADTAADTLKSGRRVAVSGYAPRNLAGHCRWCDFQKLCNAEMIGGSRGEYDPADYGLRHSPPPDKR